MSTIIPQSCKKSRPPAVDELHKKLVTNYLRVIDTLVAFGFTDREISLGLDRSPDYVENCKKQINAPRADTIFLLHERFFVNPYAFLDGTAAVILNRKELRTKLAKTNREGRAPD